MKTIGRTNLSGQERRILEEIIGFENLAAGVEELEENEQPTKDNWKVYGQHIIAIRPLLRGYQGELKREFLERFTVCENTFRRKIKYRPHTVGYYLRAEEAQLTP